MNETNRWAGKIGWALCCALVEFTTYGQTSLSVEVSVPLPTVEIRVESDFYEPLTPHGEWVVIGSYGRCWRPARVEAGWRPYSRGHWQRTDVGWYWISDEPWAWATYHYGRWDFTDRYGWYWVPQTQWAPAWVSWHEGGGYVGWAPLQPSVTISVNGYVGFSQSRLSPRAFVFVKQNQFLEPISPSIVVVNQTIIKQTVVITNTKLVNQTVVNEGPATTSIEKASGRKIQVVPVHDLRVKHEAAVVAKPRTSTAPNENKVAAPAAQGGEVPGKKPGATPETRKPAVNPPPAVREPSPPKVDKSPPTQEKPSRPADQRRKRPTKEQPPAIEKRGPNPAEKEHEKRSKE